MKTKRTTKVVLLAAVAVTLLGMLASGFTTPPKARAGRINTTHNIVTAPLAAPANSSTQGSLQNRATVLAQP